MNIRIGLIFAITALLSFPCIAFTGGQPTVEYSALSTTETAEGVIEGKIYHAPNKERREMDAGGEKMTLIMRQDIKKTWMLMIEDKSYIEMPINDTPDKSDMAGYEIEQTDMGPEDVDGRPTTKSKIIARHKDGHKFGGFWWTSKEGIVVKMDMLSVEDGSKDRIKMQLHDIKIGKQDPQLFEIPAGFVAMGMGMPNLKDMMSQEEQAAPAEEPQAVAKEKKKSSGFGFKDLINMAK